MVARPYPICDCCKKPVDIYCKSQCKYIDVDCPPKVKPPKDECHGQDTVGKCCRKDAPYNKCCKDVDCPPRKPEDPPKEPPQDRPIDKICKNKNTVEACCRWPKPIEDECCKTVKFRGPIKPYM